MHAVEARPGVASWAIVAGAFFAAGVVESLSWNQFGAFTPLYLAGFGVAPRDVPGLTAFMASASWVVGLPLAPFWGVWADRYSRRAVIVRSALVEGVLFIGWALSTSLWMALVFKSLSGLVLGNTGVMLAVQSSVTPRARLGLAIGIVGAGGSAGTAVGPLLGALLIHLAGVRGMLLFDGVAAFVMAAILMLAVREPARPPRVQVRAFQALRGALADIAASPWIWGLFLSTFLALCGGWLVRPLLPIFLARQAAAAHVDTAVGIGLVLTMVAVCQAAASPFWGRLVDRYGAVRVLMATAVLGATSLAVAGLLSDIRLFGAVLLIFGAVGGAASITNMSLLAKTVPEERKGAILGLIYFPMYLSGLVAPPVGALLFPLGQPLIFLVAALITLLPIAVVLNLRRVPLPEAIAA